MPPLMAAATTRSEHARDTADFDTTGADGPPAPETGSTTAKADLPTLADGAPAPPRRETFGLIDVAGCRLAVSALSIREAVPFPATLSTLAAPVPGLLGAMVLRRDTIPLVDLGLLLGLSSTLPLRDRVVLILLSAETGRLVGLVVDSLEGMTALEPGRITHMGVSGRSDLLAGARSFVRDGLVVGLLDPQRLFDLPGLPYALQHDRGTAAATGPSQQDQAVLLCSYAGQGIAFAVTEIQTTIPMRPVLPSPLACPPCDGVVEHHGQKIPILDSLRLMGLGRNASRPERSASVAMRVPAGGLICIEIDRFFDIAHLSRNRLLAVPPAISQRSDLFTGVYMHEDGTHFLIADSTALLSEPAVVQLAGTTIAASDEAPDDLATDPAAEGAGPCLICHSAQRRMGCRLTDIVEILHLPRAMLEAKVRHDAYMGCLSHRNQLIPIFSMAHLFGAFSAFEEGKACVLLFRIGQNMVGAVAEGLLEVAHCSRAGTAADRMLRKTDTGEFIPVFDAQLDLPAATGIGGPM
ncbi:chemotaxis protein CheW [Salipiger mangrovisoli]|uniref:Chemotaxis protein CheW n=1 Tax=Salipiger mangrovisoli TaxID=2865933 RepID=A0ABR9WW76_9RHOB|nr:chemotaxis protein CheW [Salipiger mangrovisoli]MBE9635490.1 chemotaxis protein CheW [Salipiger mangrovisoli]